MSSLRLQKPSWVMWAGGAALVLAGLLGLWYVIGSPYRAISKEAIGRAVAAQRWDEVEDRLRHWLQDHPQGEEAWETLGRLLARRGRPQEALTALRRVREGHPGWINAQTVI